MIEAFESSTETVAFLFQVLEDSGQINHEQILAGYSFRQRLTSNFQLVSPKVPSNFQVAISTGVHNTRLAEWVLRVARKLDVSEKCLYQVEVAALLHDVGKIGVPDAILKNAAPLTPEERAIINRHPKYSWSILHLFSGARRSKPVRLASSRKCGWERLPGGIKRTRHSARLANYLRIDAYDAMVSNRCYRKGLPHDEAIRRLLASSGSQFDPEVVRTFFPIAKQEAAEVFAAAGTSATAAL